ncbi:hypothetical protein [Streptomyces griseus]|uniref:hypothetical protein n=1 Tax=Streptomyces griseus TaxID=1911 RepID=UPI0036B5C6F6
MSRVTREAAQGVQVSAGGVGGHVLVVEAGDRGEGSAGLGDGVAFLPWCPLGQVGEGEIVRAVRLDGCVPAGLLGAPAGVAAPQGRGLVTGERRRYGKGVEDFSQ